MIQPGRRAYLNYGEGEWHARLVLDHIDGNEYLVATPDFELFGERLDGANPDVVGVRLAPVTGGLPVGVPGAGEEVYDFGALSAAQIGQLIAEGKELARAERAGRGIAGPGAGPGAAVDAAMAAVPVPALAPPAGVVLPVAVAGGAAAAAAGFVPAARPGRVVGPGGAWVLDEPLVGHDIGDEFTLPVGAPVLLDRCLATVAGETAVLKFLGEGASIDSYARERAAFLAEDFRTLPLADAARTFPAAVSLMTKANRVARGGVASPLSGPETAESWLSEVRNQGHTSLISRHEKWVAESGVVRHSAVAYEHEVLSRAVHVALCVDALNGFNLVCVELLLRRLQLLEEAVSEDPTAPTFDGARHFLGIPERRGGAFVAPSLRAHVAAELGREAAILKEKRKAREARVGGGGSSGSAGGPGGGGKPGRGKGGGGGESGKGAVGAQGSG